MLTHSTILVIGKKCPTTTISRSGAKSLTDDQLVVAVVASDDGETGRCSLVTEMVFPSPELELGIDDLVDRVADVDVVPGTVDAAPKSVADYLPGEHGAATEGNAQFVEERLDLGLLKVNDLHLLSPFEWG